MVNLSKHVNTWCHVLFEDGREADGRIELLGDGFGFASPQGAPVVPIRPEEVADVTPAEERPIVQVPSEPGKRISTEADLHEFIGHEVLVYWRNETTSKGRLEYSLMLGGRLALVAKSQRMHEGDHAEEVHWQNIERILAL